MTAEDFASLLSIHWKTVLLRRFSERMRILVPQTLREFAGLEKDVVLTGNLNRIEVWSKEKWNEICDYDDMDSIAESMQDMGITI